MNDAGTDLISTTTLNTDGPTTSVKQNNIFRHQPSPSEILLSMSSWERARFLPWSRIPQDGRDLGNQKERIFRQMQREAVQQEKEQENKNNGVEGVSVAGGEVLDSSSNPRLPFTYMGLFKSAAFGGCIGAITGTVFGFMDGMRGAGESKVLKNASNMAKAKYLMQGTTRSATVFGVFFGGFHSVKYGLRVAADPGEFTEIAVAGALSMGALMSQPAHRASMPYASMLIIMDSVHIIMKDFNN